MKQIPMFKVAMNPNVDDQLLKVIHSGWIGQGEAVNQFEKTLNKKSIHLFIIVVTKK